MTLAAFNAKWRAKHEALPYHDGTFTTWTAERTARTPYHYADGVTLWVAETDMNPEDQFL